jgi:hypothetical protein
VDESFGEEFPIAGESAGDGDVRRQAAYKAGDKLAAVDVNAVAQDQRMDKVMAGESVGQLFAGGAAAAGASEIGIGDAYARGVEFDGREDEISVGDARAGDFTGGGTADDLCVWECVLEVVEGIAASE